MLALLGLRGEDRRKGVRGDEDRRVAPRVPTRNLLKIVSVNGKPVTQLFNLVNISETGFRFINFQQFHEGTVVQGVVNVREFDQQVPVDARIVWSEPLTLKVVWVDKHDRKRSHTRHAGAAIMAMADSDRYILRHFVHHKMQMQWAQS